MEERRELYGHVLRAVELPHFRVTETRYDSNTKLPPHRHSQGYLSLVVRGAYREIYDRQVEDCPAGTVIFHPRDEVHEDIFYDSETTCLNLHLATADVSAHLRKRIHHHRGFAAALFRKLYRELYNPDEFSDFVMDGLALTLLGEVLRRDCEETRIPRWLIDVQEMIHSSFRSKITFASLAHTAGVHPVHLSRTFHKYFGCTVGEYLRNLRVEFASLALRKAGSDLTEIALEAGFSDQSGFTKTFKRVTGYTPGQYKKRFGKR